MSADRANRFFPPQHFRHDHTKKTTTKKTGQAKAAWDFILFFFLSLSFLKSLQPPHLICSRKLPRRSLPTPSNLGGWLRYTRRHPKSPHGKRQEPLQADCCGNGELCHGGGGASDKMARCVLFYLSWRPGVKTLGRRHRFASKELCCGSPGGPTCHNQNRSLPLNSNTSGK